jgi:tetratricopeptide (TPR) repeat protein
MRLTKVHLAALAFVAGVLPAAVSADGWFSRMGEVKDVTLTDLLRTPHDYVDVEVRFKVYFDATGKNYNPYFTRFNEDIYGNFSAWPIDARLYDKRDYPRPYPFFFASKMEKVWKKVQKIDHLDVIEIEGAVRHVFKGQPWIEVLSYSSSGGGLSESDIKDVIAGDAHFVAGRYDEAARHYGRADGSGLPKSVRADLQRRLGDACFRAGEFGDAQDAYETALRHAPESEVLKQGVAASEAAGQHAKAKRRGKAVEGEVPELAPTSERVGGDNGVDEVIRLLEDPAQVAAEVEGWRLELEKRAAALRGGAEGATAVSGTETPKAPEPVEPAPAPVPEEEPVAVEEPAPEPAEGVGEAPEGCAEPVEGGCAGSTEAPAAEEPVAEEPAEATEPPVVEEPAEVPAETTEAPAAEEPAAEEPAETTETPAETTEPPAEVPAEPTEPAATEPTSGCGEQVPAGCGEQPEGCADGSTSETAEGGTDASTGEQACGESPGCGCAAEEPTGEETVAVAGEERVVWVSGQMVRLPRLPFFGCEDVTDDDLRAIIEEVVRSPENAEE